MLPIINSIDGVIPEILLDEQVLFTAPEIVSYN
jgi:hypothetical protein